MPHFVVTYRYTADTAGRDALRAEHRKWLADREQLLVSGPTDDDGAVLILRTDGPDNALSTLDADPFAVHGLIAARTVTGWDPVVGPLSAAFREPLDAP